LKVEQYLLFFELKVGGRRGYQVGARAWEMVASAQNTWKILSKIMFIPFGVGLVYLGAYRAPLDMSCSLPSSLALRELSPASDSGSECDCNLPGMI
jgi:hypothetical protein